MLDRSKRGKNPPFITRKTRSHTLPHATHALPVPGSKTVTLLTKVMCGYLETMVEREKHQSLHKTSNNKLQVKRYIVKECPH